MKPIARAPSVKAGKIHGSKKNDKCNTRSSALNIPLDLLQEILSRLGPKANIQASVVCKTWFEVAVSVRKFPPIPWLLYLSKEEDGDYILFDPSWSQTHKQNFPELRDHVLYSKDGWLLAVKGRSGFFLNPFTRERIKLPYRSPFFTGHCLAFSAAPSSTSCVVISFTQLGSIDDFVIGTWRPGETVWTIRRHLNQPSSERWDKCVFSNGLFYALSNCGCLGVFDPSKATWDVLPVRLYECAVFSKLDFVRRVLMMEHEGNIFVVTRRGKNNMNRSVFKLNRERMAWEEKSELCGVTVFARIPVSLTSSCSYEWTNEVLSVFYSLVDDKISRPPTSTSLSNHVCWVDPPHNNVNL